MDISKWIQPGMSHQEILLVSDEHIAAHVGSGPARVLATPWLIMLIEHAARNLLAAALPAGLSSVGIHIDVHHLAPTPLGARLHAEARVERVEGAQVDFSVTAWDDIEQVGSGFHRRMVIDEARFLRRVQAKAQALAGGEPG